MVDLGPAGPALLTKTETSFINGIQGVNRFTHRTHAIFPAESSEIISIFKDGFHQKLPNNNQINEIRIYNFKVLNSL